MALNQGMFTSNTDQWATPQKVFDKLDAEFNFTIDVCADANNAKCFDYYDKEMDGLSQQWEGRVWMNPPYGRSIYAWIEKMYNESKHCEICVCLIPARTDTKYWHNFAMKAKEIRFVVGRLKFGDSDNSAPFPSAIVVFDQTVHIPTVSSIKF